MPASKQLDTVGVFARDAEVFGAVGEIMLTRPGPEKPLQKRLATKNIGRLLYPVGAIGSQQLRWFPHPDDQGHRRNAEEDMEIFIRRVEDLWGVKREVFNLDELWEKTRPEGQPANLDDALGAVSIWGLRSETSRDFPSDKKSRFTRFSHTTRSRAVSLISLLSTTPRPTVAENLS
jgi:hypothetical protein